MSRKAYPTTEETSTLVVGYKLPNNRSEVDNLIKDINHTYKINIGVIDIATLLKMAVFNAMSTEPYNKSTLENLNGYIKLETV